MTSSFKLWLAGLALLAISGSAHAQAGQVFAGSTKIAAQWSGVMQGGTVYYPAGNNIAIRFQDYMLPFSTPVRPLYGRICMTWTDSGNGNNHDYLEVTLMSRKQGAREIVLTGVFPTTWSGSGLVHSECSGTWGSAINMDWQPVTDLTACGPSWATSCDFEAYVPTGGYDVQIKDVWFEFMHNP